jgi:hypothetical protein
LTLEALSPYIEPGGTRLKKFYVELFLAVLWSVLLGCESDQSSQNGTSGNGSQDQNTDSDTSDSLKNPCEECPGVGESLSHMACAAQLCDPSVFLGQSYSSPTGHYNLEKTHAAVNFWGNDGDLAPRSGDSYAVMQTGIALSANHTVALPHPQGVVGQNCIGNYLDPFSGDQQSKMCEAIEWSIDLRAPENATGISFDYVFFSSEYDEYVGSKYNDKFYALIQAPSTNSGAQTVINFTDCRSPSNYSDFTCESGMKNCTPGQKYCYISINNALSDCCWLGDCPQEASKTDISGTGFECAPSRQKECKRLNTSGFCDEISFDGAKFGSSTGWLNTQWEVQPGEEFTLTFHLHDTADFYRDSAVIIDNIRFVEKVQTGTVPI